MPRHWLLKTEPGCYSIANLSQEEDQTTSWTGVRNYQARNFIRDGMAPGDLAIFYHSVTDPSAVGVVRVVREPYPDPTAWDPEDRHYDPKSPPEKPQWYAVDVRLERIFPRPVPLGAMRAAPGLAGMELLRRGSRLSVMPVSQGEFALVCAMAEAGES
ncbi:EVE domain-containing protein [Fundidesulfovibrio soli]|uniref:EVE domain-containing protein n=1 Tax=Fundidesulfovibrio soli TaxID=2922716 RepID=UPI001FAF3280|nr:EVE domain-containing protein [Fundidesulfovibrio soli]